ncbi:hypothetical protein GCM10010191_56330 [Actinomadura vinacea]|uniref:Uncharacterized protein n=1 Tax=Actinomadura vinacea TaxID=115336 RepID=A0ABN3JPZ4_9ACTN
MLTIYDETITVSTMKTAAAKLAPSLNPVPGPGQAAMALLSAIIFQALNHKGENFTETHVAGAYQKLVKRATDRAGEKAAARKEGKEFFRSKNNESVKERLLKAYEELQPRLQELENGDRVIIFRGTDPLQTLAIMQNQTFGGTPPASNQTGAPESKDAARQSGFGEKDTTGGRIEEWSLAPQTGFATGGFMLIALVHPSKVNLPDKGKSRTEGERGVVGYTDHSLSEVAIMDDGRDFEGVTPESLEIDALVKRAGRDQSFLIEALRGAA